MLLTAPLTSFKIFQEILVLAVLHWVKYLCIADKTIYNIFSLSYLQLKFVKAEYIFINAKEI